MKITYDKETDSLDIYLIELVGIEVFDAKEVLGKGKLPNVIIEKLPSQAAV